MQQQSKCPMHGRDCHQGLFSRNLFIGQRIPLAGVAHQNGTVRFGNDPATSALDVNCRAHEVDNLYVVDGSFFPSSGAVNPALTIMANALRVGDHMLERLAREERFAAACAAVGARWPRRSCAAVAGLRSAGAAGSRYGAASVRAAHGNAAVQAVAMVGLTVSDMDRSVAFYTTRARLREGVRRRAGRRRVRAARRECSELGSGSCGCGWARSTFSSPQYLAPTGRPAPVGRPEQRSLVPARRDHRERHGPGLRAAPAVQGPARLDRPAAAARGPSERGRHPRILLQGPGRPSARGAPVSAGQGRPEVARSRRTGCSSASTTPRSWCGTPRPASRSIATCSASGWPARA